MNSIKYTLYGDLDGKTVAELRSWLAEYPDDARVDVQSRPYLSSDGWVDQDYFVIESAK